MPELVLAHHELWDRASEIPEVEDCYLVGIWNNDFPENTPPSRISDNGFYPVPWRAAKVDALRMAWDRLEWEEDWNEQWGGSLSNTVRLGCNTPGVAQPVMLRFRWGEGHPKVNSVEMLPHGTNGWGYCPHCEAQLSGSPRDCPARRLNALRNAYREDDQDAMDMHMKAIDTFHGGSITEEAAGPPRTSR